LIALALDSTRSLHLSSLEKQPLSPAEDDPFGLALTWFESEKLNLLAALDWAAQGISR